MMGIDLLTLCGVLVTLWGVLLAVHFVRDSWRALEAHSAAQRAARADAVHVWRIDLRDPDGGARRD